MEPKAAVKLVTENVHFKACNVQLGIVISDNDSSSISAMRAAANYEIIKHADKNHTSKGVTNELYKIKKDHKELTADAIKYLQRCFAYCLSQNVGDAEKMSAAIKNIPHHCFNIHANCGTWCGYHENSESYQHSTIGSGFKDPHLFESLKCLFEVLASKTDRFVAGVSSNANESLNAVIASKAPKSRLYGTSSSGDYRVACAVNKKNDGEEYVTQLAKKLSLSLGVHTETYGHTKDKKAQKRYQRSSTKDFKKRRLALRQVRTQLRHKKEFSEGPETYQSDIGLLSNDLPAVIHVPEDVLSPIPVYFDLETGGFSRTADILQIAAKHGAATFSVYIKPVKKIDVKASQVTGLKIVAGQLQFHDNIVQSVSLSEAMQQFYTFLSTFKRKCILVAHNCKFDAPRILIAIEKTYLVEHFKAVVEGFCDTLPVIKNCTKLKGKGENKLEFLANKLGIPNNNAHNAINDVLILEQVIIKLDISNQKIIESAVSWDKVVARKLYNERLPQTLKELSSLCTCTSISMRKKLAAANISYDLMLETFRKHKFIGLLNLLGEDENGNVRVTKQRSIIKKIATYLESKL
ncbi:uncharacterized protein LOC113464012 [Ceratina calcarata]|uniref:Uncharacterized protein LOC113464012 n=1 Tax=Ceratina calcarata TaxID=156304 RepID=A0AAJ7W8T0_9HYME|nr:uncharacterized protein LOC113464012 [Ceratina calcarata]